MLLFWPPPGSRFWWALAAVASLIAMHLTYWFVTHPVNRAWTKNLRLTGPGAEFFALFGRDISGDWLRLRDVWERSHLVRAALGVISLVCLSVALMK
jgi:hypothetical protein